jgi:hypothetical protein
VPQPADGRGEQIACSLRATAELRQRLDAAFMATTWNGDNGCKRLLDKARGDVRDLEAILLAAQALHEATSRETADKLAAIRALVS